MKHNIVKFDVIESTNTEALNNDYPDGTVILAKFQTKGRGQRGNVWKSDHAQNLTFTIVSYPNRPLLESFPLSMLVALSVTKTLQSYNLDARIKWPNDIYVGDFKICGMLIENTIKEDSIINKSIAGIGINVSQTVFPSSIPNPTSMALCGVHESVDNVLDRFLMVYDELLVNSDEDLYKEYIDLLWRKEGFYPYEDEKGRFIAEIKSINPHTGRLMLKREDGTLSEYYFKEVRALLK